MAESVGGIKAWVNFLYIFKCGVENVTATKTEVQEYAMGLHLVDVSLLFESSLDLCKVENFTLVTADNSTSNFETDVVVLGNDGKLAFEGGNI